MSTRKVVAMTGAEAGHSALPASLYVNLAALPPKTPCCVVVEANDPSGRTSTCGIWIWVLLPARPAAGLPAGVQATATAGSTTFRIDLRSGATDNVRM